MNDWIQGLKFIGLADFVYKPAPGYYADPWRNAFNNIAPGDYRYLENTLLKIEDGQIIYTHTFYAKQLFELIGNKRVTVISHNCDTPADIEPPENTLWYTTNVAIDHPRVKALPFGIQDDIYYPEIGKTKMMVEKAKELKTLKNWIYIDHRIWVNPEERIKPYNILAKEVFVTAVITEKSDKKGTHETPDSFNRYLHNLYHHAFVISPAGNGISTCRPWEALYMGTYPIEIRNINNSFFTDLPFCFVDSWEDVTPQFIVDQYYKMNYRSWNLDMLNFKYWKNKIYEDSSANGR